MRIALFTETYLPYINGVVTHVKILKEGLEALGHEVLIVTADKNTIHHYIEDGILHCPAACAKKFYDYSISSPISSSRLRLIRQFDPDIIHIHNEFGIGISGVKAAKRLNVPLIYTIHTMYDDYLYYIAPRPFIPAVKKATHKYLRYLTSRADALTGPSEKCNDFVKRAGVTKHVTVIPNAVELDAFNPNNVSEKLKNEFREKYNIPKDVMITCFVGRLGKEKSVDILLDYWAKEITEDEKIHLVVIGDGPCKEELEEQAKKLGISNMVTFLGKVMHDKLPAYYASCDLYITASLSDTNSISMLEGMATGLPVLQRYDEVNKDQVVEGKNGYTFNSPKEMADCLRMIKAKSPEELSELKASVIESVKQSGSIALANRLLEVYKSVTEKNK